MCGPSAPWRSGYAAACKAVYTGSIPVGASSLCGAGLRGSRVGKENLRHSLQRSPSMAKSQADKLFERLRANGLRKRVARDLSQALGSASGNPYSR